MELTTEQEQWREGIIKYDTFGQNIVGDRHDSADTPRLADAPPEDAGITDGFDHLVTSRTIAEDQYIFQKPGSLAKAVTEPKTALLGRQV